MGLLTGLAFVFCTALRPLDVGKLCTLNSIACRRVTVCPLYGNRDTYYCF